ncbi:hypothetical protein HIM_08521 [Hirsutella minnesotensis 3608]|uniref:Carboxypeptidase n=1 Tax=Hirsutella minnesotensis 3608 TaxID=1043627 RepID=A0A0F7ZH58_9HYPO|nr:hypothetical protein HIM_08521 [Hirsutella minnesotensis 3608]
MRCLTPFTLAALLDGIGATQWPLARPGTSSDLHQPVREPTASEERATQADRFSKKKQDNRTCPTYGESQWTGTINVSKGHDLFYWFFESRSDPENDPIIIWMNGGPGASSTLGLLDEIGPCWLLPRVNKAEPNPWSWNNNASLLFLDQPAGAGLSHLEEGMPLAVREEDTAEDFQQFLNIFFTDVFPSKKYLPIHIAAESYGGHYGPVYLHHILESRRYGSKTAFWGRIDSLILVDAVIDFTGLFYGMYELYCDNSREKERSILNATACEHIALHLPELQRLGDSCQLAYRESAECNAIWDFGQRHINAAYKDEVLAGRRHSQNIHKRSRCDPNMNWLDCEDPTAGNVTSYLNQDWVKKALDKDPSYHFDLMGRRFWATFSQGALWKPTTKELVDVLEDYAAQKSVADVKLLVMNGNRDPLVTTPGSKWTYDRLRWREQADFAVKKWKPLPLGLGATGEWKATSSGRLAMVTVDGAGHTLPGDAREAAYRILEKWLASGWRM